MADLLLDNQSVPTTPASGQVVVYTESTAKVLATRDDGGNPKTLPFANSSTANQTGFASDTYLAGSNILVPSSLLRIGTTYRLSFDMVKTGAGTATPILIIRMGTLGTIGDGARVTFTFAVGTAVIDTGVFDVYAHFRVIGASAVLAGMAQLSHHLAATGLSTTGASGSGIILATSSAFDATTPSLIIGASFNGGTSFSGTNTVVESSLLI